MIVFVVNLFLIQLFLDLSNPINHYFIFMGKGCAIGLKIIAGQ